MTLENSIKDVIAQKLSDGTVEKLVEEHVQKGVTKALENLFGSYGDVTKVIEKQVKSVMVPYLEGYDYSKYITKLDSVLVDVLKVSALENKKILENFKELIVFDRDMKTIKLSELFEAWKKFVANDVETDELEINYDDGVSYETVEVTMEVEEEEGRSWSSFEGAKVFFECEHDEKLNFELRLSRWKGREINWDICYEKKSELHSLRYLNEFEILLMNLTQNHVKLEMDMSYYETDYVEPDAEPEASWS